LDTDYWQLSILMKFTDRREFLYDPEVFSRFDTQTALKIHDEFVFRHSGKPFPRFFEVDRTGNQIDPLWHQPVAVRTQISRKLDIAAIVQFEKLNWTLVRLGRVPQQKVKYWISNLSMQRANYFPLQGDLIYWNGYRTEITTIEFEPNSFWQQTNVWLGLIAVAELVPEGDSKQLADPGAIAPAEQINVPDKSTIVQQSSELRGTATATPPLVDGLVIPDPDHRQ
jgi:hypothetical protein